MICKEMINPIYYSDYHSGGHELEIKSLSLDANDFSLDNTIKIEEIFDQSKQNIEQLKEFWTGLDNKWIKKR